MSFVFTGPAASHTPTKLRITAIDTIPGGMIVIENTLKSEFGFFDGSRIRTAALPPLVNAVVEGTFSGTEVVPNAWIGTQGEVLAGQSRVFTIPEYAASQLIFYTPLAGQFNFQLEALNANDEVIGTVTAAEANQSNGLCVLKYTNVAPEAISLISMSISSTGVTTPQAVILDTADVNCGLFLNGVRVGPIPYAFTSTNYFNRPNQFHAARGVVSDQRVPQTVNGQMALYYADTTVPENRDAYFPIYSVDPQTLDSIRPIADEIRLPIGSISDVENIAISFIGNDANGAECLVGVVNITPANANTTVTLKLSSALYSPRDASRLQNISSPATITFDAANGTIPQSNGEAFAVSLPPSSRLLIAPGVTFMGEVKGYLEGIQLNASSSLSGPENTPLIYDNLSESTQEIILVASDYNATYYASPQWKSTVPMPASSLSLTMTEIDTLNTPTVFEEITLPFKAAISTYESTNSGEIAWFTFTLAEAAVGVRLETTSINQGEDTSIAIYKADGTQVSSNDDKTKDDWTSLMVVDLEPGMYYVGVSGYEATWPLSKFPNPDTDNRNFSFSISDITFSALVPVIIEIDPSKAASVYAGHHDAKFILSEQKFRYDSSFKLRVFNQDGSNVRIEAPIKLGTRLGIDSFGDPIPITERVRGGFRNEADFTDTIYLGVKGAWVDLAYDVITKAFQVIAKSQWTGAITSDFSDTQGVDLLYGYQVPIAKTGKTTLHGSLVHSNLDELEVKLDVNAPVFKTLSMSATYRVNAVVQLSTQTDMGPTPVLSNLDVNLHLVKYPNARKVLSSFQTIWSSGSRTSHTFRLSGIIDSVRDEEWEIRVFELFTNAETSINLMVTHCEIQIEKIEDEPITMNLVSGGGPLG